MANGGPCEVLQYIHVIERICVRLLRLSRETDTMRLTLERGSAELVLSMFHIARFDDNLQSGGKLHVTTNVHLEQRLCRRYIGGKLCHQNGDVSFGIFMLNLPLEVF